MNVGEIELITGCVSLTNVGGASSTDGVLTTAAFCALRCVHAVEQHCNAAFRISVAIANCCISSNNALV